MRALASGRGLHNVPAELTSFAGRRRELAEIKQRLGTSRLVTLTGPGGVGKTRLALRAATDMARAFPDGVWLVQLAAIQDPPLVTQAVFDALGLQDRSAGWSLSVLTDYLAGKHLLLILDNCEHLLNSCAVLASTLLRSCSQLRVMATSRQALGTPGEVRVGVLPLSLPEDGRLDAERLRDSDAIALFAERAAAVMPSFSIDESNAAEVVRLCRRLDGIPLALELAAVRLEALSLDQLNRALGGELSMLEAGHRGVEARQQTLESTIDWSYRLLSKLEQLLWARISVFAGGLDEEAAIRVCADPELPATQIVGLLAKLVETSILKRDPAAQPTRYLLLETLRQYGRRRLRELGGERAIQAQHRDWVLELATVAGAWDQRQVEMFNRMYMERDNLWSALDFCLRQPGEAAKGAEICRHLYFYWACRGPVGDARRVVRSLLEAMPEDSLPRARLLWVAASLANVQNDYGAIGELSDETLRIGHQLNDSEVIAWALIFQSVVRLVAGESTAALDLAESALASAKVTQLQPIVLGAMTSLCFVKLSTGDLDGAVTLGEEALEISHALGEMYGRAVTLNCLSQASWRRGDLGRAEALAKDGAACHVALGDRHGLSIAVETLAWMAAERSAFQRTATLLGCAERLRESVGSPLHDLLRVQHERAASAASERLGEAAFASAVQRGHAIAIDEAIAYALDQKKPTPRPPRAAAAVESTIRLTRREQEIAALVGQGLSNRQIAAKMVVSDRTAESHILNILNKLGFNSRSQIASWAATHLPIAPTPKG